MHTLWMTALAIAATPASSTPTDFGDAGSFTVGGGLSLARSTLHDEGGLSLTSVWVSPQVEYFVIDGLALAVSAQFSAGSAEDYTAFGLGPGLGVGYYIPLTAGLGLFPKVSGTYSFGHVRSQGAQTTRSHSIDVAVEAPFIARLDHFFIGFGPRYRTSVYGRRSFEDTSEPISRSSTIEVSTRIGGWFD